MADLEALGYLDHPHTSAGRVPTDEGYRVFVDSLMDREPLPPMDSAEIAAALGSPDASAEQVMETASHLLSRLSRNVGFVLAPDIARASFRHIDLVSLAGARVLVVMVSATGLVTQKVIELDERLSADDLQACANYLNTHFAGMTLSAIREQLLALMQEEKALYDSLLKRVVALGERAFTVSGDDASVYLDGASNILAHPEFDDVERMRALFKTFEEKSRLVAILNECISGEGIRVLIGRENPDPELQRPLLRHRLVRRRGRRRVGAGGAGLDPHGVRPRRGPRRPGLPLAVRRPAGAALVSRPDFDPKDRKEPDLDDLIEETHPATAIDDDSADEAGLEALPEAEGSAEEELAALRQERDELKDALLRRRAEFENYRRRVERDRHTAAQDAVAARPRGRSWPPSTTSSGRWRPPATSRGSAREWS